MKLMRNVIQQDECYHIKIKLEAQMLYKITFTFEIDILR